MSVELRTGPRSPEMDQAFEFGRQLAVSQGPGLNVEVRRITEWQRRDMRGATEWKSEEGDLIQIAAMLARARHVFEVAAAGIVLASFRRRCDADAFYEGFMMRRVRRIDETVRILRRLRHFRPKLIMATAA